MLNQFAGEMKLETESADIAEIISRRWHTRVDANTNDICGKGDARIRNIGRDKVFPSNSSNNKLIAYLAADVGIAVAVIHTFLRFHVMYRYHGKFLIRVRGKRDREKGWGRGRVKLITRRGESGSRERDDFVRKMGNAESDLSSRERRNAGKSRRKKIGSRRWDKKRKKTRETIISRSRVARANADRGLI